MNRSTRRLGPHRPGRAGLALLALALLAPSFARAAESQRLRMNVGLSSYYTDNLLQYSDEQIRQFDAGSTPTHYSIESVDDGVWRPSLSLTWEADRARGHGREIRLRGSGEFHGSDKTADFHGASLAWRESFGTGRRLSLLGSYIPSYYLRQLFDEDVPPGGGSQYRRAEFSLFVGSIGWRQPITRRVRAEVTYQFEHRGYNDDFPERTSNTHQGEAGVEWSRRRGNRLEVHGGYRKSIAKADDSDAISNDDANVGYHGLLAGVGGTATLLDQPRLRAGLYGSFEFATRSYDSDLPGDVSHYGRDDARQKFEVGLRGGPSARLTARGFFRHEKNRADFPAGGGATLNPTDYDESQIGVALDWSATLWRSGGDAGGPVEEER